MGPDMPPQLIVTFATPGPYAVELERLVRSLNGLGLLWVADVIPAGTWIDAVRMKPRKLLEWRRRYPGADLLFVDADSVMHRDPWPACDELCRVPGRQAPDLGLHRFQDAELLTGTILMPGRATRTERLLDAWVFEDETAPDYHQPQRVLNRLVTRTGSMYRIAALPPELCWIFDLSVEQYGSNREIIVEHLQASREFRKGLETSPLHRRRERVVELGKDGL